jgi:gamma-glutamyl hercynylcysteine S-oxide synthase
VISESSQSSLKEKIYRDFYQCRMKTLALFEDIDEATFCHHAHPAFSPVGWHFGHIAYTESLWLLERTAGFPCLFPQYRQLFAADGLPKTERVKLPNPEEIRDYLDTIRDKALYYLNTADVIKQERLWRFLLQHESQHNETITFVLELIKSQKSYLPRPHNASLLKSGNPPTQLAPLPPTPLSADIIEIPAGEFEMGNDSTDALDNERTVRKIYLNTYWIDRYPVTCGQYRAFMEAGGYQNPEWWSQAGWEWQQIEQVIQPLYWRDNPTWDNHPVCGVSWYEAEAYARFVGKRLPTEMEWEKAASWNATIGRRHIYPWGDEEPRLQLCNYDGFKHGTTSVDAFPDGQSAYGLYDTLGNVWEWTASWFDAYPGFQSYPYTGYSQVYFDNQHRVLRGGSWATRSWSLRCSFRNWYHPTIRQILAGFRCAKSGE